MLKKKKGKRLTERFNFLLPKAELAIWRKRAALEGMTLSGFVQRGIIK